MELGGLDLNLLVALDALLKERSVTRAGIRTHVSQPAMSASLRRLRRHFNDLLLERVGTQYELTQLACSLLPQVAETIRMVEQTFEARVQFEPKSSTRQFAVAASDFAISLLGKDVVNLTEQHAPNVRLHFEAIRGDFVDNVEEFLRNTADVLVLPRGIISGFPSEDVFNDRFVIVSWMGNDRVKEPLTPDDLTDHPWVTIFDQAPAFTIPDKFLEFLGFGRRSDVGISNFGCVPWLISGTDRLAILPERYARMLATAAELRISESPVGLPPLREAAWWHPSRDDAGNKWLRGVLIEAGRRLEPNISAVNAAHQ
jgi:DNA-binding transcriptional LysR family regulator